MRGLPVKYYRHVMEKTGAVVDKFNTFVFKRLKKAIESKMIALKNAK